MLRKQLAKIIKLVPLESIQDSLIYTIYLKAANKILFIKEPLHYILKTNFWIINVRV